MFVKTTQKAVAIGISAIVLSHVSAGRASAADAPRWKSVGGTIPVTVTLANVKSTAGPIYVSIQKRHEFMGLKGHGGIITDVKLGDMTAEYKVDAADEYSISIWHDINDDGIFSMDEAYNILDGWGNSASAPMAGAPKFDDMKVSIPQSGKAIRIEMKYPS